MMMDRDRLGRRLEGISDVAAMYIMLPTAGLIMLFISVFALTAPWAEHIWGKAFPAPQAWAMFGFGVLCVVMTAMLTCGIIGSLLRD